MKNFIGFIGTIILLVVLVATLVFCIESIINDVDKAIDDESVRYKRYLGDEFILQGDTLKIIDYSIWEETFTLSNGQKVNKELIFKRENETHPIK